MTITDFLLARIAEDEEMAAATRDAGRERYSSALDYDYAGDVNGFGFDDVGTVLAAPARVLAECAAKRAIVEMAGRAECAAGSPDHYPSGHPGYPCEGCEAAEAADDSLAFVLRHLAAVYADHPDYQQDWAP